MNGTFKVAIAVALLAAAVFGGYLYGRRPASPPGVTKGQAQKAEYTCPMHPFILKDRPGSCAICGMELVKKIEGAAISDKELLKVRHVALSPAQQVMANLATVAAEVKPFTKEIVATGIVTYNQERQGKVTAWLAGRIDRLLVKSVGSEVAGERPIAELYSLDLVNAQEEYLLAWKAVKLFNSSIVPIFSQNNLASLFESRQRLRQLGFREQHFEQLEKSGKAAIRIPIHSPISGVVTEKLVQEGQYVNVGDPLFSVADLSLIWVELELFESDLPFVKVGREVSIVSPANPGHTFRGRVKLIYPFLDPKTRTIRLRVEIPNRGLKLKPDMYVTATIKVPLAESIVVPVGAVMDTGKRQVVWIESRPGVFLQRDVKAGTRSGDLVQILAGLKVGEKVAASGGYLIDSESQLSHGLDVPVQPPEAVKGKDGLDMGDMKMK